MSFFRGSGGRWYENSHFADSRAEKSHIRPTVGCRQRSSDIGGWVWSISKGDCAREHFQARWILSQLCVSRPMNRMEEYRAGKKTTQRASKAPSYGSWLLVAETEREGE
jgi:hypothetical protein